MSFGMALKKLRQADELPSNAKQPIESNGRRFLNLIEITRVETVFQPRTFVENDYEQEQHLRALTEALKRKPRGSKWLDPVVIKEIDHYWVCIDGHHRLDAYAKAKIEFVHVDIFLGTVDEAVVFAGEENNKAKRNLSQQDRLEFAWRLTTTGIGSKGEVIARSGVSDGTVAKMRRMCRELKKQKRKPDSLTYPQAIDAINQNEELISEVEWTVKAVAEFANRLRRAFGKSGHKNRSILSEALQEAYPSVIATIIENYALDHRETIEYLFKEHDQFS